MASVPKKERQRERCGAPAQGGERDRPGTSSRKQRPLGLTCLKRIGNPLECPKEKSEDDDPHYVGYEGEELTEYRKFYGRVIVRYHKDTQQPIQYAERLLDNLIVEKVLSSAESL